MKIYRILSRETRYLVSDEKYDSKISYNYNPLTVSEIWERFYFYIGNPKVKNKNFYNFGDFLVFDKKAFDTLNTFIHTLGEYLPIEVEGVDDMYLFNVKKMCDCIDEIESFYEASIDRKFVIKKGLNNFEDIDLNNIYLKNNKDLVLISSKIDSPLFIIQNHNGNISGPFCTDGFFPPNEEFFYIYKNNKLTGLEFEEIKLS